LFNVEALDGQGNLRFSDMYSHMSLVFLKRERSSMIFYCYDVTCLKSILSWD